MADDETLAFYTREAATYASYAGKDANRDLLDQFLARLKPGDRVLDFGCGSGWAGGAMLAAGFRAEGYDGSPGLAAEARAQHGLPVTVGTFDAFRPEPAAFDGVWASFSLLHDTREAMPGHLARLAEALRPGGMLYVGLKEGTGMHRDRLGRRYTYFTAEEMRGALTAAGFAGTRIQTDSGTDYAGDPCGYLHITAVRR